MPFMLSTFFAIRGMAKLPVESFQTGGALWFTDLTIADPFFLLPVLASASIITIIHVNTIFMKYFVFLGIPKNS